MRGDQRLAGEADELRLRNKSESEEAGLLPGAGKSVWLGNRYVMGEKLCSGQAVGKAKGGAGFIGDLRTESFWPRSRRDTMESLQKALRLKRQLLLFICCRLCHGY